MKLLLVAATLKEVNTLLNKCREGKDSYFQLNDRIALLITGAGTPNTILHLTKHLSGNTYDGIINIGIAGSYHNDFDLTSIVEVVQDEFADLGYEENNLFYPLEHLDFFDKKDRVFSSNLKLELPFKKVKGITRNTVTGDNLSKQTLKKLFNPGVESMEGAAVCFTASKFNIPFTQIRSISNYAGERNKNHWKLEEAIEKLNQFIFEFFKL